jgi:hypothetical protein
MCKTLEETAQKIKDMQKQLETLEKEVELLHKAQCPFCKQRMQNLCGPDCKELLRTGD